MKITIVSDMISPFMGGNEVMIENLTKELVKLGVDVTWVGMRLSKNDKEFEINEHGVKLRRLNIPFNERRLFCFHPKLFKLTSDADVLQFHTFVSAITGGFIGKLKNKATIGLTHEFFTDKWEKLTKNKIEQKLYPFIERFITKNPYDAWICPCEYTRKTLNDMGVPKEKIKVIPHGLQHDLFYPRFATYKDKYNLWNRFVITHAGRIGFSGTAYSKNIRCLFDTFKKVKVKIPSAVLLMAGTGWEDVAWYPKKLGLEIGKDIIHLGKLKKEELPFFYSSGDVFLTSTLSEGFCFVACESEACGTPVVAFKNAGALDETASVGKLVSPQTSTALAKGVIEMYKFPNLRRQKSRDAMKWVKQYDWKKVAQEYKKTYEDVLCWHKTNR